MHQATESRHTNINADCGGHDLRTARSPSTVTARLETQGVEDNVYGVIAQGIECTAPGSLPRHSHRAYTQNQYPFFHAFRTENVEYETCPNLASHCNDRGF